MNGWMVVSMFLGVLFVPAVIGLATAAREYQMVDDALLHTLTMLHQERDAHARDVAMKDSVIRALLDTREELQRDLFAIGAPVPTHSRATNITH